MLTRAQWVKNIKRKLGPVIFFLLLPTITRDTKGQTNLKWFFQADVPKNEQTNSTLLLVDLFSFLFWKKVKTPKRRFEINWPLRTLEIVGACRWIIFCYWAILRSTSSNYALWLLLYESFLYFKFVKCHSFESNYHTCLEAITAIMRASVTQVKSTSIWRKL